jgi:hypothetical protein
MVFFLRWLAQPLPVGLMPSVGARFIAPYCCLYVVQRAVRNETSCNRSSAVAESATNRRRKIHKRFSWRDTSSAKAATSPCWSLKRDFLPCKSVECPRTQLGSAKMTSSQLVNDWHNNPRRGSFRSKRMATKVDVAEEVRKPGRDCADLESNLRKGEVFRRGVRLATVRRLRLSMNGQAYANATRCALSIFQTSSECWLGRGGISRRVLDGFFDCLSGFARDLCDLPH